MCFGEISGLLDKDPAFLEPGALNAEAETISKLIAQLREPEPKGLGAPRIYKTRRKLLQSDNVVSESALGFEDLGLKPTALDSVLPSYLSHYRRGGRFSG